MRAALVANNVVDNVIVCDADFALDGFTLIELPEGSPVACGWLYANGQFAAPAPESPREISALDFKRRFTLAEWVAADALRLQGDGVMRYFFDELLMVASTNGSVHLDHTNTIQGVGYMQQHGILTAERAAAILG